MGLIGGGGSVDLGSAHGSIIVDLRQTQTQLENQVRQLDRSLAGAIDGIGARFQRMGAGLTATLAPVTAFVGQGVLAFARFDDALGEIEARTRATSEQMDIVRETAIQMGQDTAFSATDAANAMLQLLSSGYDLNQTLQALEPTLALAAAGGLDLGFAADAVTDILAQFQLEAEAATDVTNALAAASQSSSATTTDMIQAFANVGPVARNYGLSVEETSAAIAVFAENGIKGSEAGTQLRSMLNNMTRNTDRTTSAWNRLGTSMYDAQGNMRPIDDIIDDINEGMEGMSAKERNRTITDLAGTYGQMGLSALLASDGIDQMETQMQNSAGAAEVAAGRMGTFRGTVNQLKSSIETLSITVLGPLIEKYLMPLIQTTTEYLNVLTAWLIANPEMAEQLGLVLGVLAGIGPAMIAAGTGLRVLAAGVKGVSLAIGALTSPIGLLIAGAAALYLAYQKNFMGFRDLIDEEVLPKLQELAAWFLEDALPEVVNFLDRKVLPALNALGNWFISDVLPVVVSFVQSYVMPAIQGFFDFLAEAWTYVGPALDMMAAWFLEDMLPAIVSLVENAVIPIFQRFVNFLARMWEYVGPALGDIAAWFLTDALPVILAFISEVFVPALELLGQAFIAIWDVVEPVFFAMMDFLFNEFFPVVGDVIQGIGDLIEELVKAMQSVWADVEGPLAEFGDGVESVMNDVMEVVDDVAGAIGDLIEGFKELTSVTGTSERFTLTADWRDNGDGTMTLYRDGQPVRRVDSEGNIIEEYARGGRFRGNRPMLVGHGEELIVPDSSGLVVNNDQLATALNVLGGQMGGMMEALAGGGAGAGGGDVVLNFGDVVVPLDGMSVAEAREKGGALAESFTEKLERLIRYRGRGVFSG